MRSSLSRTGGSACERNADRDRAIEPLCPWDALAASQPPGVLKAASAAANAAFRAPAAAGLACGASTD